MTAGAAGGGYGHLHPGWHAVCDPAGGGARPRTQHIIGAFRRGLDGGGPFGARKRCTDGPVRPSDDVVGLGAGLGAGLCAVRLLDEHGDGVHRVYRGH